MKVSPSVLARLQAITTLRQINDSQFAAMCGVGPDGQRRSRNWGNKLLRRGAGLWPVTSRHAFAERQGLPLDYFDEHVTYPVPSSAIQIPSREPVSQEGRMISVATSSFSAEELALVMQYRTLTVERATAG